MNALLLQNIAPELAEHVKRVARSERCTINDAVLALLQRGIAANDAPRLVAPVVCTPEAAAHAQPVAAGAPTVAVHAVPAAEDSASGGPAAPVAVAVADAQAADVPAPVQEQAPTEPLAAAPEPLLPDDFEGTPEERALAMAEAVALREALLLARDIPGPGF